MKRIYLFSKVPFNCVTKNQLVGLILLLCKKKKKAKIFYLNAYGVVSFLRNKMYARAVEKAQVVYADGVGPVWASKVLERSLPERVNAADFIDDLLKGLSRQKASLYLLGCTKEVVRKTAEVIANKYKGISLIGYHHGFFNKKEEKKILSEIIRNKPNLILVGMGLPKQEFWINRWYKFLPNGVYFAVGGLFHYIAGTKPRAPKWICDWGLEWFYRFLQEPRRLAKRYLIDNLIFVFYFFKSFFNF